MDVRMDALKAAGDAPRPPDPPLAGRSRSLRQATREFEAYVLEMLLHEMRKSVENGGLFQDPSMDGYRVLMDQALAQRAAEAGTFGLAEQMLHQLEPRS